MSLIISLVQHSITMPLIKPTEQFQQQISLTMITCKYIYSNYISTVDCIYKLLTCVWGRSGLVTPSPKNPLKTSRDRATLSTLSELLQLPLAFPIIGLWYDSRSCYFDIYAVNQLDLLNKNKLSVWSTCTQSTLAFHQLFILYICNLRFIFYNPCRDQFYGMR